jgi:hypothetical protein
MNGTLPGWNGWSERATTTARSDDKKATPANKKASEAWSELGAITTTSQ